MFYSFFPANGKSGSSAPGPEYQAHHGLPWAFKDDFAKLGLNVNDPKFGIWVRGGGNGGHQSWSHRYNELWRAFLRGKERTAADVIRYFNKLNNLHVSLS